jgi:hypothetical protein
MPLTSRTAWLKVVALICAVASLTINFGLIDLVDGFTGYVDQARNQVLDVGWGALFGLILPLGFLTQVRRPERRIGGIQQIAVVALALAVSGAAGEQWWYLALAAGIAGLCAVLLALHPARRTFLKWGRLDRCCSRSEPLPRFPLSSTHGGWPRPRDMSFRLRMLSRTACTTGR